MPTGSFKSASQAYAYPLLLKQLLLTPLVHSPTQEIVYSDISRYDYRTLNERIHRLAGGLQRIGVTVGKTVAVMDWDSSRYLECYFAVPMMGAVIQTVNVKLTPEQILYTLNHAQADVLLVNAEFLPIVEEIAAQLETVKTFVLLTDTPALPASKIAFASEYENMLASSSAEFTFPDFDENTRATTFYTTGTTGLPKGVHFSHRQLVLHTLAVATALGTAPGQQQLRRDDVYMPLTPMFHVHAWGLPYVATMLGIKQVYPGAYQPERLCRLIRTEKVTFSHCVPTVLHMILNHPHSLETDLSRLKLIIGGSAMPQTQAIAARQRGIDIFGGYGLSETCPILSIVQLPLSLHEATPEEQAPLRTKAGLPIPLVDMQTVDDDMKQLPHDGQSTGEVVVRAPWLTQSYLHDDNASEQLWSGGYLHTGDIGHIDAGGYLQITDREKDVIKTGGEWLSSLQMESMLLQHPAVQEVAVIAQRDDKWGERPLALVQLRPEFHGKINEAALRKHVAQNAETGGLGRFAILVHILFVDGLLKTSVGKTNKRELRRIHGGDA
ncbi:MAG: acyl-CoA synthetase (AMP-forming)/AMP-acid ligase [Burkholderiaceae bacterium]|nr:acyl-CoA synthetase (AMP-forming)/AMP-acid ligase [Burkholderiaceae bacterium]